MTKNPTLTQAAEFAHLGPGVLNLTQPVEDLTADLLNIYSVSGAEVRLADAVQAALERTGDLEITRDGDAIIARTNLGRDTRIVLAGHLDTVPLPRTEGSLGCLLYTSPSPRDRG